MILIRSPVLPKKMSDKTTVYRKSSLAAITEGIGGGI